MRTDSRTNSRTESRIQLVGHERSDHRLAVPGPMALGWILCVVVASALACSSAGSRSQGIGDGVDVVEGGARSAQGSPSHRSAGPHFVEQELDQLSSPFRRETVLALNAIVGRSLDAIQRFDLARRALDEGDEGDGAPVEETLVVYFSLSAQAERARFDMAAAGQRLRSSDEHYNEAIFAAMVRFVDGVDREIAFETERLLEQFRAS